MTILTIRQLGDPVLRQPAAPVERFDEVLEALAADMIETMHDAPGSASRRRRSGGRSGSSCTTTATGPERGSW